MPREEQDRNLDETERTILGIPNWISETKKPRLFAVLAVATLWVTANVLTGCKEEEKEAAKEAVREFIAEEEAKSDAKKDEIWGDLNRSQRKTVPNPFENSKESEEGSKQ